jgi:hypothetical protein
MALADVPPHVGHLRLMLGTRVRELDEIRR